MNEKAGQQLGSKIKQAQQTVDEIIEGLLHSDRDIITVNDREREDLDCEDIAEEVQKLIKFLDTH